MTRRTTILLIILITLPVVVDGLRIAFHDQKGADLTHYADHGRIIVVHVIAGLTFGILGALQVAPWFRNRHWRFHRRAGRVAALAGATAGVTALWLNLIHPPVEGAVKEIGTYVFGALFLFALAMAVIEIRRGALARHRVWMLRAYAIGMAPATQVVIGLGLFALLGDVPVAVAVTGHIAAWGINLGLAEWAIRKARSRPRLPAPRAFAAGPPAL